MYARTYKKTVPERRPAGGRSDSLFWWWSARLMFVEFDKYLSREQSVLSMWGEPNPVDFIPFKIIYWYALVNCLLMLSTFVSFIFCTYSILSDCQWKAVGNLSSCIQTETDTNGHTFSWTNPNDIRWTLILYGTEPVPFLLKLKMFSQLKLIRNLIWIEKCWICRWWFFVNVKTTFWELVADD